MMESLSMSAPPPFERFYADHREAVFAYLTRLVGPGPAEDAFQETFLRALRAYGGLRHAEHLRAWVFTIATRVAADEHRRRRAGWHSAEVPDIETVDERPGYEDLSELTRPLPPKERAAVVLRYGYDFDYEQIGAALGSSPEAARQAASSGVRRLRRKEDRP